MKPVKNEEKFLRAYDEFGDAIFRHCYFRVFNRERAKELTQDAFMKTWEYIAKGNAIDNLRAFLYRVANNLIIDQSRKKKEISLDQLREEGFDIAGSGATDVQKQTELKAAKEAIQKLEPQYREVVIMRHIDDLAPKEIAQILGESENAVSVRIHRGLKQLENILQNHA